jgi:hypothetical protein
MSVNVFLQAINDGVAALPAQASSDRENFYGTIRERLRQGVKQPDRLHELEMQLEVAISSFETANYPRIDRSPNNLPPIGRQAGSKFVAPDEGPTSPMHYVWLQIVTGCGAISTVADVLKPIINIQSGIAIGSVILAVALTAILRLGPARRALLVNLRLFCIGLAISMAGLFGVSIFMPESAPNGVLAATIPGIADLQDALEDIRLSSKQMAENTSILVEQGRKLTEIADPKAQAKAAIEAAGYTVDEAGMLKAIKDGNTAAYYFQLVGVSLSPDSLRDLLSEIDDRNIGTLPSLIANAGNEAKKAINGDVETAAAEIRSLGFNGSHDTICKSGQSGIAPWIVKLLGRECQNEAQWVTGFGTRLAYLGITSPGLDLADYRPNSPDLVDSFDPSVTYPTARFVRINVKYSIQFKDVTLRNDKFEELMTYTGLGSSPIPKQGACGADICVGSIDLLYLPGQVGSLVAITPDGPADPDLLTPQQVAELPPNAIWGVGTIPYWNALEDGAMVFIAGYDSKTHAALAAFCPVGADSSVRAEVNVTPNIDKKHFAERMFRYVEGQSASKVSIVFDKAREYPFNGSGFSGDGIHGLIPLGNFLHEMRDAKHLMIVNAQHEETVINIRGFAAALKTFRKYADCANP